MNVAKSYAQALYQAARERNVSSEGVSAMDHQFTQLVSAIEQSKPAQSALYGPIATAQEKTRILNDLGRIVEATPLLLQFLELLVVKQRLPLLPKIREAFVEARLASEGGVVGRLVVAEPMGQEDVSSLTQAFSRKLGKKVTFQVASDPSLLAGMKVTVSGVTYDGSLRSQLQRLRDRFVSGFALG
jgi:F-type H+-transporting ATPase subunit delta